MITTPDELTNQTTKLTQSLKRMSFLTPLRTT